MGLGIDLPHRFYDRLSSLFVSGANDDRTPQFAQNFHCFSTDAGVASRDYRVLSLKTQVWDGELSSPEEDFQQDDSNEKEGKEDEKVVDCVFPKKRSCQE